MFDDEIDYNILEQIKKEESKPEIVNYDIEDNNKKEEVIVKRIKIRKENTGRPDSLREIITLSSEDLRNAEESLYDKNGKLKSNDEILDKISGSFRNDQIYNEGLTYGINSGLYAKTFHYKTFFEEEEIQKEMDEIFIFDYFTLFNGRVQSPILVESKDIFIKKNDNKSHEIKQSYIFKEQAKIISTPKNWREYLEQVLNVPKPNPPHEFLIPRTKEEKKEWEKGVREGWEKGVKMAEDNIIYKLKSLRNDLIGMIRYKLVTQNNMIINPMSSEINISSSRNEEGTSLNIGELIFELNKLPEFNPDMDSWKALPQIDALIIGDDYE